ncbi:MAG: biosynthetic-type acetolactate synthase large subunit [Candidatus Gastranaerophilaceae bacterium]|nr:biosynthetic-type acetolactate synthase large subunit [Candidatus Gastranaerophilaceae bacterium]
MLLANTTEQKTFTGAQIIVKTLKNLGVDCIFGYPGGVVLDIYDELFKQNDIKHYLVRHEQAAVHAAEGYARVSGKCGVVLVTSGPGAANTVSGIANAYLDGYPVVVLTGQVFKKLIGTDAFQEINIVDITRSCTKASYQVTGVDTLEHTLKDAFNCAMSGKKGPVVVDLARDIFSQNISRISTFKYDNEVATASSSDIEMLSKELLTCSRPVIVAGGGVIHSKASGELIKFAEKFSIPVVTTMMGTGAYPQFGKCYIGMIGIFGQKSANKILRNSDLIISLGARFNDRISCCFSENDLSGKIIQIDINQNEISRAIPAKLGIVSDIKYVLQQLNTKNFSVCSNWLNSVREYKTSDVKRVSISDKLQSFEVIDAIYKYTKDFEPVITTEVGQHQMWTVQNYKFNSPNKFLTSGGSGTMGFGLPAAIGASIALGKSPVVCISGDGSFQMNEQELATCIDYKLPVKIFIMNNGYLGMVRQLQQKAYVDRYSETKISNPDFLKLADAYGIKASRVKSYSEIKPALDNAFRTNEPYIIDFVIEPFEIV